MDLSGECNASDILYLQSLYWCDLADYVMLLVKYLQYLLLFSMIKLYGHGFWRRRGRGLLSVWFSSDSANGFTVAPQARFTLKK